MEKHIKPERTPENVPYIVHEAEMARQERHIKRIVYKLQEHLFRYL